MSILYNKKGFSLAELMISIFILAFVLITMLGIIGSAISSIKKGENHLVAASLAQQMLETYKNDMELDFYKYDLGSYPDVPGCPKQINGVNFSADIVIGQPMGPLINPYNSNILYAANRVRQLTVTVNWSEQAGGAKHFILTTYVNNTE